MDDVVAVIPVNPQWLTEQLAESAAAIEASEALADTLAAVHGSDAAPARIAVRLRILQMAGVGSSATPDERAYAALFEATRTLRQRMREALAAALAVVPGRQSERIAAAILDYRAATSETAERASRQQAVFRLLGAVASADGASIVGPAVDAGTAFNVLFQPACTAKFAAVCCRLVSRCCRGAGTGGRRASGVTCSGDARRLRASATGCLPRAPLVRQQAGVHDGARDGHWHPSCRHGT